MKLIGAGCAVPLLMLKYNTCTIFNNSATPQVLYVTSVRKEGYVWIDAKR